MSSHLIIIIAENFKLSVNYHNIIAIHNYINNNDYLLFMGKTEMSTSSNAGHYFDINYIEFILNQNYGDNKQTNIYIQILVRNNQIK